jgi:uncharacterized protein (DUF885 family)
LTNGLITLALMSSVLASCADTDPEQSETDRINGWFAVQFEEVLSLNPLFATRLGRKTNYDKIDDFSEEGEAALLSWQQQSVSDLRASFNYDALSEDAKISYDLWVYQYEKDKALEPYRNHRYMFTHQSGPNIYLPNLMINYHSVQTKQDMQDYITRVGGVARAIDQTLVRAKSQTTLGIRPPYFSYSGAIIQSRNLVSGYPFEEGADESALYADAKRKIAELVARSEITEEEGQELLREVKAALLTQLLPTYEALITWLQRDSDNVSDKAHGVGALVDGENYYNARLKNQTTVGLTADQIHALGLREVARLRTEIGALMETVGFEGDLQAFFEFVRTDAQFYYPDTDAGRQRYLDDSAAYLDHIDEKLPEYFGLLPKADLVVKRVESYRERDGGAQHYTPAKPDGSKPGIYYAHLSDMTSMSKSTMEAVAYHEGNPGHHMQISIAQELEDVPEFRKYIFSTSYSEGWGLYSELLAKEMGAYQDPYSEYGRLTTEIWRAIRLVVDTGIHAQGWSEEDAIRYFQENSPIPLGAVKSEVHRYFANPAQATAYKIGALKILELRQKAKSALGENFDIRAFHDKVLGAGSVPLPILERIIDRWIDQTAREST